MEATEPARRHMLRLSRDGPMNVGTTYDEIRSAARATQQPRLAEHGWGSRRGCVGPKKNSCWQAQSHMYQGAAEVLASASKSGVSVAYPTPRKAPQWRDIGHRLWFEDRQDCRSLRIAPCRPPSHPPHRATAPRCPLGCFIRALKLEDR